MKGLLFAALSFAVVLGSTSSAKAQSVCRSSEIVRSVPLLEQQIYKEYMMQVRNGVAFAMSQNSNESVCVALGMANAFAQVNSLNFGIKLRCGLFMERNNVLNLLKKVVAETQIATTFCDVTPEFRDMVQAESGMTLPVGDKEVLTTRIMNLQKDLDVLDRKMGTIFSVR